MVVMKALGVDVCECGLWIGGLGCSGESRAQARSLQSCPALHGGGP